MQPVGSLTNGFVIDWIYFVCWTEVYYSFICLCCAVLCYAHAPHTQVVQPLLVSYLASTHSKALLPHCDWQWILIDNNDDRGLTIRLLARFKVSGQVFNGSQVSS